MKNPIQIIVKLLGVSKKGEVHEVASRLCATVPSDIINSPGIIATSKKEIEKFLVSQSALALLPDAELIQPKELNANQLRQLADTMESDNGEIKATVYHISSNHKHIHLEVKFEEQD